MTDQDTYQVPDSAAFFIRGGLDRAIRQVKREISQNEKFVLRMETDKPDVPEDVLEEMIAQANWMIEHNRQWLREATAEFAKLPRQLAPDLSDL